MRSRIGTFVVTMLAAAVTVTVTTWPLAALAQEFVKVEGAAKQEVPAVPFVAIAYGVIWLAVLTYVFFVARAIGRVQGEIAELRRKVEGAQGLEGAPRR